MAEIKIAAERRTEFGKGAARRLRRDKKVPGVVYGHGAETQHVSLPAHELMLALKNSNALLSLQLDGGTELVLPKAVQRDPVRYTIEHVDLVAVKQGEKVTVEVPVQTDGKIAPGGLLEHVNDTITIEAEATHIPQLLVVSVEGLEVGDSIHAKDVSLPTGAVLAADAEMVVIHVLTAQQAEEEEPEEVVEVAEGEEQPEAPAED
ncbi:MAG: 50S ribosomal protein L25/general stress protein Ctc [Candidatus Nanopelagicales bacterium]